MVVVIVVAAAVEKFVPNSFSFGVFSSFSFGADRRGPGAGGGSERVPERVPERVTDQVPEQGFGAGL